MAPSGQSAVLVAALLVVLLAMLALTFDGGYAYFQRRLAQTAADAGAMAGARDLCVTGNAGTAAATAVEYATERNAAVTANATVLDGIVTVTTTIPFNTAFASILGQPEVTASAIAEAGCFVPSWGEGILPVAWFCRPPPDDPTWQSGDPPDCGLNFGPDFIIMDAANVEQDIQCRPADSDDPADGEDCDLNDDGANDITGMGDRSWLNLDGENSSAEELEDFLVGERSVRLNTHAWLEGQTGVANKVFQAAADRIGDTVIVPVFDKFCDSTNNPQSACPTLWDADDELVAGAGTGFYYHIVTFAVFEITCVDAPGPDGVSNVCPGKTAAVNAKLIKNNARVIEGHFIEGYVPGLGGEPSPGGVDAGAFTLYITR